MIFATAISFFASEEEVTFEEEESSEESLSDELPAELPDEELPSFLELLELFESESALEEPLWDLPEELDTDCVDEQDFSLESES